MTTINQLRITGLDMFKKNISAVATVWNTKNQPARNRSNNNNNNDDSQTRKKIEQDRK